MPDIPHLTRQIRVGIIALAPTDELLSNVGSAAYQSSGAAEVEAALPPASYVVIRPLVVHSGKLDEVRRVMRDWCDAPNKDVRCDLILTVGGDGLSPGDVLADAAVDAIERPMPALTAYLRASAPDSPAERPYAAVLSRATAGTRAATLIVNIPGCYEKPANAVAVLLPLLPEALRELGVGSDPTPRPPSSEPIPPPPSQPAGGDFIRDK